MNPSANGLIDTISRVSHKRLSLNCMYVNRICVNKGWRLETRWI
jgi:hypothetical protein